MEDIKNHGFFGPWFKNERYLKVIGRLERSNC